MYNTKMKVPYITENAISEMLEIVPDLTKVVNVPLIQTADQASAIAVEKMNEALRNAKYEYVREVTSVVLDEDTKFWTVHFTISGD